MLNIKRLDSGLIDELDFTDVQFLKDFRYLDSHIEKFKMFDKPERIIKNIDVNIEVITDWNRIYKSSSTGAKLLASDIVLDIDDIEKIINTKIQLTEMIVKNYGAKGFVLLFMRTTDSTLFNAFFGAISEHCINKREQNS